MKHMKEDARCIVDAAIAAVDPYASVMKFLSFNGDELVVTEGAAQLRWAMSATDHVYVVGCGKAGAPMALAVEDLIGGHITGGVVTVKYDHVGPRNPTRIRLVEAGHPQPDEAGVAGAREALALLDKAGSRDLVIALISGGGSALWPQPVNGISLQDKQAVTKLLLVCGADIHEMNSVRKHLSAIKGGRAAQRAGQAQVVVLSISDVIGDNLDVIASGPFAPDVSTFVDAWDVITKYNLTATLPESVGAYLRGGVRGEVPETPKDEDRAFRSVCQILCATNALALSAAAEKASVLGYEPVFWDGPLCGEARDAAVKFCAHAMAAAEVGHKRIALIAGGETTVTLGDNPGKGGRNQEFALASSLQIEGREKVVVAGCGTDGTDGPTDAAGGIVDGTTAAKIQAEGLDPAQELEGHDAYWALKRSGDLLVTGPTNTNVMDIQVALVA